MSSVNTPAGGILFSPACVVGEFFQAVLQKESDEALVKKAGFYDYLEVQPLENNEFLLYEDRYSDIKTKKDLQDLNKKVIEIGEKTGIPVCAINQSFSEFFQYRPGKQRSFFIILDVGKRRNGCHSS